MDYTKLLNELNQATLFDLHRLQVAIGRELNNPQRITEIKNQLRIGMHLTYFHGVENRSIKAKLLELKQKKAVVFDLEQQKAFLVPYCLLNLTNTETAIYEQSETLTANNLKVGDGVGFNNAGVDVVGMIKRLNPKTVTLITTTGEQWRVAYCHLYRIHDAESMVENLLPLNFPCD